MAANIKSSTSSKTVISRARFDWYSIDYKTSCHNCRLKDKQLNELKSKIEEDSSKIMNMENEYFQLEMESSEISSEKDIFAEENEKLRDEQEHAEKMYAEHCAEWAEMNEKLKSENNDLKECIKKIQTEVDELKARETRFETVIVQLQKMIQTKDDEIQRQDENFRKYFREEIMRERQNTLNEKSINQKLTMKLGQMEQTYQDELSKVQSVVRDQREKLIGNKSNLMLAANIHNLQRTIGQKDQRIEKLRTEIQNMYEAHKIKSRKLYNQISDMNVKIYKKDQEIQHLKNSAIKDYEEIAEDDIYRFG